ARAGRERSPPGRGLLQGGRACTGSGDPARGRPGAQHQGGAVTRVALIDAGGANLGSVRYAFERLGVHPVVVREANGLDGAERIVLPGVGAAAPAMARLRERGLDAALRAAQVPVLGICLGMQLLYEGSEEGDVACLGVVPGW